MKRRAGMTWRSNEEVRAGYAARGVIPPVKYCTDLIPIEDCWAIAQRIMLGLKSRDDLNSRVLSEENGTEVRR